jgi:predicted RNA-binding protein with PIN domain
MAEAGRPETFIIDGYNLLRRAFRYEEEHGLEAGRAKLEVRLREFQRAAGGRARIVLVYDGVAGAVFSASSRSDPEFRVVFAPAPRTADEAVLEECRRLGATEEVTVVTSDLKDIASRVKGPRVRHRTSEEFAEMLDEAMERGPAAAGGEERPEPRSEKPAPEEMKPAEVEEWLKIFSEPKPPPGRRPRRRPK